MKRIYWKQGLTITALSAMLMLSGCNGSFNYEQALDSASEHYEEGRLEEAIEGLEKAIAFEPAMSKAYLQLAKIYIDDREFEQARDVLLEGFELNPTSQELALLCADMELYLSNYESAKAVLTKLNQMIGETKLSKLRMDNIDQLIEGQASKADVTVQEETTEQAEVKKEASTQALKVEVSSILEETVDGKQRRHDAQNMFDDNLLTVWAEADEGNGVGETITIFSEKPFDLGTLGIINGFAYDEALYYQHNRLLKLKVTSDKGDAKIVSFSDHVLSMQDVTIDFRNVTRVTLEVAKVVGGSNLNDLCISEMRINNRLPMDQKKQEAKDTGVAQIADVSDCVFTIEASSILEEMIKGKQRIYYPQNMFDDDLVTVWSEGSSGDGVGETLVLKSNIAFDLETLSLTNGFAKNRGLYDMNNRLTKLKVSSDKGDEAIVTFRDGVLELQDVAIGFKNVKSLTLEVLEVNKGSKYNDLCISEMRFNGQIPRVE